MFNAFHCKTQNVQTYECTYVAGYLCIFKAHNCGLIEDVYYVLSHFRLSETYDPTRFVPIRFVPQTPRQAIFNDQDGPNRI